MNIVLYRLKEGFINPLFFALLISISGFTQTTESYSDDLLNFHNKTLIENLKTSPKEVQIFYNNKIVFLNTLFNQIAISKDVLSHFEQAIDTLEHTHFNKPKLKQYYIGEAQLMLSLLHVKFGNQMTSARYFVKAYDSFEKNLNNYPKFKDPEIALRFMEISASILPKSLQWITSLFGVKSDKNSAIKALKDIYQSEQLSPLAKHQCYALNLYLKLQFNIEVIQENSNNRFVLYDILNAELYGKQKEYPLMIETLVNIPDDLNIKHFLLGKAYFITEHPDAKSTFETFIHQTKTTNNVSAAYFYMYQLNMLNNENGLTNKTKTLQDYPNQNFRDKWAKSEIKNTQTPFLIHLRNAFDRGDYKRCIELLQTKSDWNIRELYYLTNSYIYLEEITLSKRYYTQLKAISSNNTYYVPKTGLHLATMLYSTEPEYSQSILKEIKSYKNYPYQKEIEAKTELLLKTL